MGGPELGVQNTNQASYELGAQNITQRSTPEGESRLSSRSSPEKWNLSALESGPGGEGEKANAQKTQPSTPEGEAQVSRSSSPVKWNLSVGEGEKANCALSLTKSPAEKDETTYPEGGVRAWLVVFGAWCAITPLGTVSAFGSFQSYFITHQLSSYSPGLVGWIFGVYAFLVFVGGIVVGPIFDKYGPRWLILAGSIGVCLSMFLVGICNQYWQILLVFGILGGGSSCLLYTPSVAAVGHYFSKRRGNAIGIATSSSAIGGVVLPLMLEHLIPKVGFAWSTRIIASMYVCVCVIACTLVRSRLPRAKSASAMPDWSIFNDRTFAITLLTVHLLQWAYFVPIAYISSYALYHGFSNAFSFYVLVFMNAGSIFGRWLPGFTGDKIGHYNSIILMTFVMVVSVLGVWLPVGQKKAGLLVFVLIFGFASGSIFTLTATCIGQLCQTKNYGRYFATAYTIASFGNLTGIPIGGELVVREHGDYGGLIVFVGICYGGALAALVVVRILQTGWKIRVAY